MYVINNNCSYHETPDPPHVAEDNPQGEVGWRCRVNNSVNLHVGWRVLLRPSHHPWLAVWSWYIYIYIYTYIDYLMVPYGTLGYHMVPYGTIWYHMVPYGTIWYHMVPYGTLWYHMVQSLPKVEPWSKSRAPDPWGMVNNVGRGKIRSRDLVEPQTGSDAIKHYWRSWFQRGAEFLKKASVGGVWFLLQTCGGCVLCHELLVKYMQIDQMHPLRIDRAKTWKCVVSLQFVCGRSHFFVCNAYWILSKIYPTCAQLLCTEPENSAGIPHRRIVNKAKSTLHWIHVQTWHYQ